MVIRHGANTWNAMSTGDVDDYFRTCPSSDQRLQNIVPDQDLSFYVELAQSPERDRSAFGGCSRLPRSAFQLRRKERPASSSPLAT